MSNTPYIHIKYGRLLERYISVYAEHSNDHEDGFIRLTPEQTQNKVSAYESEWRKNEEFILKNLEEVIGLPFINTIIQVNIISGIRGGLSSPLVISANYDPEDFVTMLVHELIHALFTEKDGRIDFDALEKKEEFSGLNNKSVFAHVFLYAIEKVLYEKMNMPERWERERGICKKNPDYKQAMDRMNEIGAEKVLKELKNHYAK